MEITHLSHAVYHCDYHIVVVTKYRRKIFNDGIFVAGGGALIRGLDKYWREELNIPINIVEEPMAAVAKGTAKMLDHIDLLQRVQKSWEEII